MENDEKFMREALKEAKISLAHGDWPIGSVIVCDDKIIARAHNKVYSKNSKLNHAEMLVLEKAQDFLMSHKNECTLYTTSDPCPMCMGAITLCRINKLVFGIKENSGSSHLKKHFPPTLQREHYKMDIVGGVLADECWEVFTAGEPTKKLIENNLILRDYK